MRSLALGLILGATMIISANAANLVTNGGFETGDFTGWTHSTGSVDPWQIDTSSSGNGAFHTPNSGTVFVSTGCVGAQCIGSDTVTATAYLYEDLPTVVGDTYAVDFFFASGGEPGQELLATFGGTTVEDLVNLPQQAPTYTEYTQNVVATSTTTRLEFQGRQDPSWDALDDISVTDTSVAATPEPTTALTGLGACLFGLALLRRKRAR
jgi:hypothetical protein